MTTRSKRQLSSSPMPTVEPDWAELPSELLGATLQKLTVPDHIRFSCVCSPVELSRKRDHLPEVPPVQSPWLVLAGGDNNASAKFFSPSDEKRTYSIPLPPPDICIGSSHGWLVTVSDDMGW